MIRPLFIIVYFFVMLILSCQSSSNYIKKKQSLTLTTKPPKPWGGLNSDTMISIIEIANIGSEAIHLQQLIPGCSCTSTDFKPTILQPGQVLLVHHTIVFQKGEKQKDMKTVVVSSTAEKYHQIKFSVSR
jgi:hypothetical protein